MSTIKVDTVQSTSGGAVTLTNQIAHKALINAENDASLNNSLNISTNTDSGTGLYTYGMTNAFTTQIDLNCAIAGTSGGAAKFPRVGNNNTTSSAIEIHNELSSTGANSDGPHYIGLTGDLA